MTTASRIIRTNIITNPRGRDTDGTVVVVENYEGTASPDPDLELVDGDLVAPAPVGWTVFDGGVVYYSASRDMLALRVTGEVQAVAAFIDDVPPEGTATAVAMVEGTPGDEVALFAGFVGSGETVTLTDPVQEVRATDNSIAWQSGFALGSYPDVGTTVYFRLLATAGEYDGSYFDGDTPNPAHKPLYFRWTGAPHASTSDLVYTYTHTPAMIDRFTVEVLLPAETGAFTLNESLLDAWPLGDRDLAHQWMPIEAQARYIGTHRGGSQDGVAATMQVGTCTVELVNPPAHRIRPSTPIRVRTPTGTVIFTGHVENQRSAQERTSVAGFHEVNTITTITAVDAVNTLANTMRYGAVVETTAGDEDDAPTFSYETFEARADRLMRRTGLPYQITPNEPFNVDEVVWQRPINEAPSIDAIHALWSGHGGVEIFPALRPGGREAWGRFTPGTYAPGDAYMAAPIHNLRPGSTYTIGANVSGNDAGAQFDVRIGIAGLGYGPSADPSINAWHEFTFTATQTTHEVVFTNGVPLTVEADASMPTDIRPFAAGFAQPMTLTIHEQRMPRGQNWFCQSIVYESTLVNHLDLAVNTVRGRWWVDRDGVTRFARGEGPDEDPVMTFSDQPAPGAVPYVAVESAEDTARVVNDVALENHGRRYEPETGSWQAEHVTFSARDATSVATVGPRQAEVPTSIYSPPFPDLSHYGAGEELARSYVSAYADVEHRISHLRLHVTPDLTEQVAALDVYDPVDATYRDTTTAARIVNIAHQITPRTWHTNLDLIERN